MQSNSNFSVKIVALISLGFFLAGLLFYAFYYNLIIFRSSFLSLTIPHQIAAEKKSATFFFYARDQWHELSKELIWHQDKKKLLKNIITQWLSILDEEGITDKRISLQSVVLSPSNTEVYISFDRNPFNKEASTFEKLMWVEGLLKTLRENNITIPSIHFLVHHNPIHDYHLDFTQAWPITGFQQAQESK